MRTLHLISIAHDVVPGEQKLCTFCLSERDIESLKKFMDQQHNVHGHVFLSTCNRQEIYYESSENINMQIISWWNNRLACRSNVTKEHFRLLSGNKAVSIYLMELAQGFRSAIKGDDQILSQIKLAFQDSRHHKRLSTLLERCFQYLMKCNKDIINTTDFKHHSVSLAFHALKSLQELPLARNRNHKVLIVGAGQMAHQILKYISKFNYHNISITNRTRSKAEELVKNSDIHVVEYDKLDRELSTYDIVINCINGNILSEKLAEINSNKLPLFIIDLAMTAINLSSSEKCRIIHLEKLTKELKEHNQLRAQSIPRVENLIKQYAHDYCEWTKGYLFRRRENHIPKPVLT